MSPFQGFYRHGNFVVAGIFPLFFVVLGVPAVQVAPKRPKLIANAKTTLEKWHCKSNTYM
jgi:hypothetical protein